jgi:hypothetical protein
VNRKVGDRVMTTWTVRRGRCAEEGSAARVASPKTTAKATATEIATNSHSAQGVKHAVNPTDMQGQHASSMKNTPKPDSPS